jgi:serine/threonine protein kinase
MNVIDSNNVSYNTIEKLGEGSQGTTFLLEDKRHIVKLFKRNFNSSETKSKINFLIHLGLEKQLFAIPLREIVQPQNGYIAEFASGMIPLSNLKWCNQDENLAEWYSTTGGLLKRYKILIQLSAILRELHSKGLAYCDLSPNNVFVSENADKSHVFLIDLDNLRYKTSIVNNIYTPFYGAPEVISSIAPNTTMSDCYSFAVLAYELLTFNHPLIGDYVNDGESELEEAALNGKLPWVDNEDDTCNERTTGLPTDNVIPKRLQKLFKRNFEDGLNTPLERPSMAEWFETLNLGLNELLKCGNKECNLHYPYNNSKQCPFCGYKSNKVTKIQMRRWEEIEKYDRATNSIISKMALQSEIYDELLIDENTSKYVKTFHFLINDKDYSKSILEIKLQQDNGEDKILLSPHNGCSFKISTRTGNFRKEISTEQKIRVVDKNQPDKQKAMLHLKDLDVSQRVLTID